MNQNAYEISKKIVADLRPSLLSRPYIGIYNALGEQIYQDSDLDEYSEFITNFIKSNFGHLNIQDHSMPIGGKTMAFFKTSEKSMVIIYCKKGALGQLLSFKSAIPKYGALIDELIGDLPVPVPSQSSLVETQKKPSAGKSGLEIVPTLTKRLTGKEKFPIRESQILQFCDGNHSVDEIVDETNQTRIFVNQVIRKYQKKGWVKLVRKIS
ncbi:MAG: hypothetical protein ACTSRW_01155 [Candidatus Helarchaeota archaeon]